MAEATRVVPFGDRVLPPVQTSASVVPFETRAAARADLHRRRPSRDWLADDGDDSGGENEWLEEVFDQGGQVTEAHDAVALQQAEEVEAAYRAPRRAFLLRALDHQRRSKLLSLLVALSTIGTLYWGALTFTHFAERYHEGGGDPGATATLEEQVDVLSDSELRSAVVQLTAVAWSVAAVYAVWLFLIARSLGVFPRWQYWAGVVANFVGQFTVIYVNLLVYPMTYPSSLSFLSAVVCTTFAARGCLPPGNSFPLARHVFVQQSLNLIGLSTFSYIVPRAFLEAESDWGRVVIRLVYFPAMAELILAPVRAMARVMPGNTDATVLYALFPNLYLSVLGRFLASFMATGWGTAVVVAGLTAQELFLRLTLLDRDKLYARFLSRFTRLRPVPRGRARRVKADAVVLDQLTEDAGIVLAAVITLVFRVSYGPPAPDPAPVILNCALQLLVEAGTDVVPTLVAFAFARHGPDAARPEHLRQLSKKKGGLVEYFIAAVRINVVSAHVAWRHRYRSRAFVAGFFFVGIVSVAFSTFSMMTRDIVCVAGDAEGGVYNHVPCESY